MQNYISLCVAVMIYAINHATMVSTLTHRPTPPVEQIKNTRGKA